MAEQIEEQVVGGGDNGKKPVKPTGDVGANNRLSLYNEILKLKEPGFSDIYKKAGYKKFDQLLRTNTEFQSELYNDLLERGFDIAPETFGDAYTERPQQMVADFSKPTVAEQAPASEPPLEKDGEGGSIYDKFSTFSALKNMAKSVYKYGKESLETLSTFGKRGALTGVAGMGAQAENFATGTVDTKNLAKYLKKAHEVGTTQLEADFAKDDGMWQDSWDMAKILVPSVVESFANMFAAGSKKITGATALGAAGGATYGTFIAPGVGTTAGAIVGGSRALQYAMLQQGYNLEFVGTVIDELQTKKAINMDADEKTLENQLKAAFANKELMAPIYKKANTRAAAITGVDFIFSGMGTAVARNLAKSKIAGAALNTPAGKLFSTLAETTVANPVYRRTARLANRIAQVDRKIQGSKLGKAGAAVGVGDVIGGAAGETLAQSLTQDNLEFKSIAVEGLSEGKLINTLRQLGSIGEKRNIEAAAASVAEGKPPGEDVDEFVAVTQEELENYKKGNITPERAAGVKDDLDIALSNPNHINKLAIADPLYAEMVKDAYDKAIKAFENQKLYNVALAEMSNLHGLDENGVREAITPTSSAFNQKIADDFKNTLSVLQQQYKKETGDDSEDETGVSGKVGGGAESQQTESEQRASEEEAGNGGVVQAAADEVRLSDIDEMLADDDDFFNQSGDRLLSPEERQDLEQERARLTGGAVTPATGATTGATPAAAPAAVVAQPSTAAAQPTPPTDEQIADDIKNKRFAEFTYKSEDEVPEQFKSRISSRGKTNGVPVVRVTLPQSVADYEVAKAAATPATETAPAAEGETTTTTAAETAPVAITQNDVTLRELGKPGVDETIKVNYNGEPLGIIAFKADKNAFQTTDGETYATKQEAIDAVINAYNNKVGAVPAAETTAAAETTTSTAEQPTKKRGKKAATTAEAAPTTAKPTPAPKEIKPSDVEIRKGKTHATDGVYEAVYNKKVIGKISFDKKEKMWVDASGDKFAQKKDAVAKMVLQYNMKAEAAAETTTSKGEGKGKAAPTGKAEPAPTKTETKGETKPTGKTETKPQITAADVSVRKGPDFATEGVYEVMHNGKVIGRMYYDRSMSNAWMDADYTDTSPSDPKGILGSKAEAIDVFVNRYNANANTKPTAKTETKGETKPAGKAEPTPTVKSETAGATMPSSIQEAYSRRATLRMTAEALQKQMGGKKLPPKAQKELDTVNAEIAKLDNLLNTFEKEREKQRAAKAKAEQTSEKKETKTEEKPTTLVGGTVKGMAYGNYLINQLVSKDPKGEESRQGYIDAWNAINKAQENANKANSFLEDILVGMMPADKKPTAYADIREGFKQQQAGEATTETKGETKPTPTAAPAKVPSFSEFDAISADRSKMKEAKAEFIAKHGQLAYDAMKEISANFTKITKALQEKEILTKKC
jgi:hypothetical protein